MEGVVSTRAIRHAKLQSHRHHQQTNFTGQMPFLWPNQQCQSTEGKLTDRVIWIIVEVPCVGLDWSVCRSVSTLKAPRCWRPVLTRRLDCGTRRLDSASRCLKVTATRSSVALSTTTATPSSQVRTGKSFTVLSSSLADVCHCLYCLRWYCWRPVLFLFV